MQTISIKLAKRLEKLGVNLRGDLFYQYNPKIHEYSLQHGPHGFVLYGKTKTIHAYTLDEILEMLPNTVMIDENKTHYRLYLMTTWAPNGKYEVGYYTLYKVHHKNPAEAAGELLTWCIENEYIDTKTL